MKPTTPVKKRWWLSWWQPGSDCRPMVLPVAMPILGWWRTGTRGQGDEPEDREWSPASSLVAWVEADSPEDARTALLPYWPESAKAQWRFEPEDVESSWRPSDRFASKLPQDPRNAEVKL